MDRRGETRVVDSAVSDVFTGECCGSEILENPEAHRYDGSHQKYLNQVPDGSVGFVLLIEIEEDSTAYAPVLDRDLPDRVREWMIGKFGEIETGAMV